MRVITYPDERKRVANDTTTGTEKRSLRGMAVPTLPSARQFKLLSSAVVGILTCALIFSCLTLAVETGSLSPIDRQSEVWVHAHVPSSFYGLMTALSFIGASWPAAVLALTAAICFLLRGARWAAAFVIACPAGASLLDSAFKTIIHRHRPHLWPHAAIINSYSFPSGHATISSALFAGITYAVWKVMGRAAGMVAAAVSVVVVAGIGFSRVYLGVHWPSDVLAGYALGLGWVLVLIVIVEPWLRKTATRRA